jgi:hypothetical protein
MRSTLKVTVKRKPVRRRIKSAPADKLVAKAGENQRGGLDMVQPES